MLRRKQPPPVHNMDTLLRNVGRSLTSLVGHLDSEENDPEQSLAAHQR